VSKNEFLGKDHPDNKDYQEFRKLGVKLFHKVVKKMEIDNNDCESEAE
jgi:hypothetical protein